MTDVSEQYIASIFRVEEISPAKKQQASRWERADPIYTAEKPERLRGTFLSVITKAN
jgi:hypothetical protein